MNRLAIALCLAAASLTAHAASSRHECNQGLPNGTANESATPDNNLQCQTLGRAFCIMEEDYLANRPKDFALDRAATWLASAGSTGTHRTPKNTKPLVPIADFIYSHEKMPPWDAYYYSVYTCGFNKRIAPEQAAAASPVWDAAALKCVHEHPGEGDGSNNDPLRICLESSMNQVVEAAKTAKTTKTAKAATK